MLDNQRPLVRQAESMKEYEIDRHIRPNSRSAMSRHRVGTLRHRVWKVWKKTIISSHERCLLWTKVTGSFPTLNVQGSEVVEHMGADSGNQNLAANGVEQCSTILSVSGLRHQSRIRLLGCRREMTVRNPGVLSHRSVGRRQSMLNRQNYSGGVSADERKVGSSRMSWRLQRSMRTSVPKRCRTSHAPCSRLSRSEDLAVTLQKYG